MIVFHFTGLFLYIIILLKNNFGGFSVSENRDFYSYNNTKSIKFTFTSYNLSFVQIKKGNSFNTFINFEGGISCYKSKKRLGNTNYEGSQKTNVQWGINGKIGFVFFRYKKRFRPFVNPNIQFRYIDKTSFLHVNIAVGMKF